MTKTKFYRILRTLCLAFGVIFMLVACGSDPGSSPMPSASETCDSSGNCENMNESEKADAQSKGFSEDSTKCWQGELLDLFYKPLSEMSLKVYSQLATSEVISLMMLAFSLWMAFQILRHVSSPSPESMGEFWTKILRKGTLCFACGYLASSPDNVLYVINTFVMPVYITLLELCGNVLDLVNKSPAASAKALLLPGKDEICEVYNYSMSGSGACQLPDTSKIQITTSSFPDEPLQMMGCMACAVGSRLDVGYRLAMYAMSGGFFGFLVGCFLVAAFTITKLGFAMYLVDSIFRLDMMIIVMPFLILFYPFEQTRKWSITGFKIILNSSAIMLCLGVLVSMTILAIQKILVNDTMGEFGDTSIYQNFGVVPISLIFLGFVIIKASGLAVSLSESITGGSGDTKFQKKMAALVGTVAKGLFEAFTMGAGKGVTAVVERSQRLRAAAEKIQKAKAKAQRVQQAIQHLAGRDKGGDQE